MVIAAKNDTWGISGPTFLVAYVVAAVVVLIASIRARRALANPGPRDATAGDIASRPKDVAHLNGGTDLAVYAALSAMHLRGLISSTKGEIRAVGSRPDADADALERAIHAGTRHPVHRRELAAQSGVRAALDATKKRLVASGLLLSAEQGRRVRHVGFWMLAVAGVGFVRLLAGIAEAKPVGLLTLLLLAVAVVGVVQLLSAPRRSGLGDRTLAMLRTEHHGLSPSVRPDWAVYGPTGAALGVGIFGMGALWASDPAFADEIAAQRVAAGSGDGGGSSGGDSGGGSGGGCGGGGCGG